MARYISANPANLKWVTDNTYIPTGEGWLYVSVVLDLYSRRIVGWSFHSKLEASTATKALAMVIHQRKSTPGHVAHIDKGTYFTNDGFQKTLADNMFVQIVSR
jgi:putative transposase